MVVEVEVVVVEEVVVEEVVVVVEEVVVEEVVDVVVVDVVVEVEVVVDSTTKPLPKSEGAYRSCGRVDKVANTTLSGFSTGFAGFRAVLFLTGIAEHKSTRESETHTTNRHFLSLFVIFVVKIIFLRT